MNSDVKCSFVYHGRILPVEKLVVESIESAGFKKKDGMPVGRAMNTIFNERGASCVKTIYFHKNGARIEHCRVQSAHLGSDKYLGYGTPETLGDVIQRIEEVYAEVIKNRKISSSENHVLYP